jgi:hypothetical protein
VSEVVRGQRGNGMGGHSEPNQGVKDEWLTPPHIIEALGPFDLDPCAASEPRPWPTAANHYTIEDDGLSWPWPPEEFVWCNPPYGPQTWKWLDRMAEHDNGIALIFARTETAGFFEQVWKKPEMPAQAVVRDGAYKGQYRVMLFLEGRLFFHHADGTRAAYNSGAPSVLIGYGYKACMRIQNSGLHGAYVSGWFVQ